MAADSRMIDIHTHQPQRDADYILAYSIGLDAAAPAAGQTFSAGIHPWSAGSVDLGDALEYLKTAPVVAIGEIGLDYARGADAEMQKKVFEAQLDIAQDRRLPVIIHCVRAYNDVLNALKGRNLKAVIFHGYTGSPQQTAVIIERGYYISLNETSLRSRKTVESLPETPLDRIFAETDDSGADITSVYAKLAVILRLTTHEIADTIRQNYKTVFE